MCANNRLGSFRLERFFTGFTVVKLIVEPPKVTGPSMLEHGAARLVRRIENRLPIGRRFMPFHFQVNYHELGIVFDALQRSPSDLLTKLLPPSHATTQGAWT